MVAVRYTRNLFLRALCIVYLTAFLSFYNHIPGLYGDDGILPARSVLENSKHKTLSAKVHYQPTLLWLAPYLGLDINYALDVLALLGAFLAFTGFVSQKFCTIPLFAGLWSLFFSLFQVGQVFVTNGCDELLLETGFLAIFVAPLLPSRRKFSKDAPGDLISMWLVKWLLFRYLLTTGLTKLISGCPSWWGMTALSRYLEVVPLPTPLTWYAFHLPEWFLKLTQVFVNVCEIGLPFLFFLPIRSVRVTAFFVQLFLQICIVATGNFGYHAILMIALYLSLLDDQFFYRRRSMSKWSLAGKLANVLLHGAVVYLAVQLFSLKFVDGRIESNIAFTKSQFDRVLSRALTYTIYFGMASLLMTITNAATTAFRDSQHRMYSTLITLFYAAIAILIFASSTVPLASLHSTSNSTISRPLRTTYDRLHKLHVINQYGDLFSKLPGGSGRSEIVLEAAKDAEGPWHEIHFLFKPGNVNATPSFIAPHSPRLDWQMHWAAYSTYDQQPWILSFVHKILTQKLNVLPLIDFRTSALSSVNPKYVRAVLYNYRYTPWSKRNQNAWWTRQRTAEYLPAYSKDSQYLMDYLRARNLLRTTSKFEAHEYWVRILSFIRFVIGHLEATLIYWSVVCAGFAIICTSATSSNVRISSRSNKS